MSYQLTATAATLLPPAAKKKDCKCGKSCCRKKGFKPRTLDARKMRGKLGDLGFDWGSLITGTASAITGAIANSKNSQAAQIASQQLAQIQSALQQAQAQQAANQLAQLQAQQAQMLTAGGGAGGPTPDWQKYLIYGGSAAGILGLFIALARR